MKVLFYDLETAPNTAWIWGHYEQNAIEHLHEWYIMCFSYKWGHQKDTSVISLYDFKKQYKKDPEDDIEVVKKLWDLFDEADVVIAHNNARFDLKKANARFIYHDLGPPSPVKQLDTLQMARRYFKFNSNKLGDLGKHLKLGDKLQTGGYWQLWKGCTRGTQAVQKESWALMKEYAMQDTVLLEKIYLKIRPWSKNLPSFGLYSQKPDACSICGASSNNLMRRGFQENKTLRYQRFQCKVCKCYSRSVKSDDTSVRLETVSV